MTPGLKVICASVAATGHFLPTLALARELHQRGHEVVVQAPERWRDLVGDLRMRFIGWEEPGAEAAPPNGPVDPAGVANVARSLVPLIREQHPDVVVNDPFTHAPMLAAEAAGAPSATLIPDPYHVPQPGLPVFAQGLLPPRTPLGSVAWRASWPLADRARRRVRLMLNELRAEIGLPPLDRLDGVISDGLAMVATFPQLEYPRRWPDHVHITGPMLFDLGDSQVDPPAGAEPLVLVVASTTGLDSPSSFVSTALEALEAEPVRILATTSRRGEPWIGATPDNAEVVDWLSFARVMPEASLVVCHGGHGTVAGALGAGVPVLVCPAGGNTAQTGIRVSWAGAGLMLPRRLLAPGPLRWAVRRMIAEPGFAIRARHIAAWGRANRGPSRGAELLERYARR